MNRQATEETSVEPDTGQSSSPGFLRRNALMVLLAAAFVILAISAESVWSGQRSTLDDQQHRIHALKDQLHSTELKNSERVENDVLRSLGVSQKRLAEDRRVVGSLVQTVFTWDSGTAYQRARTKLKDTYDLDGKSEFLTTFMPPSRYNEDSAGKRYYYIDTMGLNSSAGDDVDMEVVKAVAGDYTYSVLVDVDVSSDAVQRNSSSSRRALLFVTVDADGDISGLSGVPANGSTRHSQ